MCLLSRVQCPLPSVACPHSEHGIAPGVMEASHVPLLPCQCAAWGCVLAVLLTGSTWRQPWSDDHWEGTNPFYRHNCKVVGAKHSGASESQPASNTPLCNPSDSKPAIFHPPAGTPLEHSATGQCHMTSDTSVPSSLHTAGQDLANRQAALQVASTEYISEIRQHAALPQACLR